MGTLTEITHQYDTHTHTFFLFFYFGWICHRFTMLLYSLDGVFHYHARTVFGFTVRITLTLEITFFSLKACRCSSGLLPSLISWDCLFTIILYVLFLPAGTFVIRIGKLPYCTQSLWPFMRMEVHLCSGGDNLKENTKSEDAHSQTKEDRLKQCDASERN